MTRQPDYRPTRACPHRWCRPLHTLMALLGVALLLGLIVRSPWYLLFLLTLVAIGMSIERLIHRGKTLVERSAEEISDRLAKGSATSLRHIVRPGWALTAATMDALFTFNGVLVTATFWQAPAPAVPQGTGRDLLSIAIVLGLIGFSAYAHRKATEPARPKTVAVPVPQEG